MDIIRQKVTVAAIGIGNDGIGPAGLKIKRDENMKACRGVRGRIDFAAAVLFQKVKCTVVGFKLIGDVFFRIGQYELQSVKALSEQQRGLKRCNALVHKIQIAVKGASAKVAYVF